LAISSSRALKEDAKRDSDRVLGDDAFERKLLLNVATLYEGVANSYGQAEIGFDHAVGVKDGFLVTEPRTIKAKHE
jgi:hypothetical protein